MKLLDFLKQIGFEMNEEQLAKFNALDQADKDLLPRSRLNKLNTEVEEKDATIAELQKKFKGEEVLQKQIDDLTADKQTIIKKHALKEVASKFKAKDMEDLMLFIKHDQIVIENDSVSGLEEQLNELKTNKAYLFEADEVVQPEKKVIKGAVPAPEKATPGKLEAKVTKEEYNKMGYKQRIALKNEDAETYNKLNN